MSLEVATYVSDLVQANPAGGDNASQGDDHLRLLKTVLQATFLGASHAFRFFGTGAAQSGDYTVDLSTDLHQMVVLDCTAAARTVTLPDPTFGGWWCLITKRDISSNAVVIDPAGSRAINGLTSISFTNRFQVALVWYDSNDGFWRATYLLPFTPYFSGGQDIPFSDIAPSANAKRLLGAATATDFSEQTIATVLEWLGTAARGDLILRGASAFAYLNIGSAGKFLKSDGTDAAWQTLFAAQSDMETGTSTSLVPTVGVQKNHPGHPKAFGRVNSSGILLGTSFNIASVAHPSTGVYTITLANAMADANYAVLATCVNPGSATHISYTVTSSTTFSIIIRDQSNNLGDLDCSFCVFGDMP